MCKMYQRPKNKSRIIFHSDAAGVDVDQPIPLSDSLGPEISGLSPAEHGSTGESLNTG
jgi:hypothetical protein